MTLTKKPQSRDLLQSYVFGMAKVLLIAGLAILFISLALVFESYVPKFAEKSLSILYLIYMPLLLFFGFLGYVIAYIVPAIVYILRLSSVDYQRKKHVKFVAFVLLFFGSVFTVTFFVPYNLV